MPLQNHGNRGIRFESSKFNSAMLLIFAKIITGWFLFLEGCMGALDIGLSASSMWDANHAPSQGRLLFQETSSKSGAWAAKTNDYNQWLQIDLGTPGAKVTSVATQGRNWNDRWSATPHNQWVTKYKLQYSVDGSVFQDYKEQGQANAKVNISYFTQLRQSY